MIRIGSFISFFLALLSLVSCSSETNQKVTSPDGNINISFQLSESNIPTYNVTFKGQEVIKNSSLGFEFENMPAFNDGWKVIKSTSNSFNETWEMPWGEKRVVNNSYNKIKIYLEEIDSPNRRLNIIFKAYDDGIGFRYEFPEQDGVTEVFITDEKTEFNLTGDHMCWWIPGDWDIYEHLYSATRLSEIDAQSYIEFTNLAQTYIPENSVNTPVTMRTDDGIHLSFHEANLTDYSGMTLKIKEDKTGMVSSLVGSENTTYKVKRKLPFVTPWRTVQISETAGELIESSLIVNLNEPNKLGDVSWFKPKKYVGIWWEMHLSKASWDYAGTQDMDAFQGGKPHGRHGATSENAKRYIDFAAKNGIGGLLVEGWNTGWEHWIGFEDREGVFDFVTSYPDYDLEEVVQYGRKRGVELIMHHETSAATQTYDKQMDTAYKLMNSLGITSVKTGYVGKILPKGEYHHGQYMVNHYRRALETAAKYQVAINAHEPIKATGIRRTLPNAISREGLRGQEFNAWAQDGGNPPNHLPTVAFTRMLSGPIDFTPGIFNIKLDPYKPDNQVNTTIAQQLALYVVIYSPIQMAADLPEYYEGHPAFQFIRDVGVDWEESIVLNGEIGEFVTIARRERETNNWFVGGITNEVARDLNITFDFLEEGISYETKIYKDGPEAHWDDNPLDYLIEETVIKKGDSLNMKLAAGGGFAISLKKK